MSQRQCLFALLCLRPERVWRHLHGHTEDPENCILIICSKVAWLESIRQGRDLWLMPQAYRRGRIVVADHGSAQPMLF